jgi:hypothetical protein
MSDRTCPKCNKQFAKPCFLKRHLQRKTPCDPIVDLQEKTALTCRFCGRAFTTQAALSRHTKHRCKIANSDEGMEKLMEHTIQRQLAEQKQMTSQLQTQVGRLTELLEQQLSLVPCDTRSAERRVNIGTAQSSSGPVMNAVGTMINSTTNVQVNQVQQVINIKPAVPWDGETRIHVSAAQIAAAFAENARLREYTRLEEHQLTDPEIAPPYVSELLMDLTKRAHADPAARNVYLNPKRADQALVHMASGKWEITSLAEATRLIFNGVAKAMVRVTLSNEERRTLPPEAQNALGMAGLLYDDEPEEYAKKARGPMAAHLSNTAPALCTQ